MERAPGAFLARPPFFLPPRDRYAQNGDAARSNRPRCNGPTLAARLTISGRTNLSRASAPRVGRVGGIKMRQVGMPDAPGNGLTGRGRY
ncbi:unnamed protein product, partial [Iphiclides podalirius]